MIYLLNVNGENPKRYWSIFESHTESLCYLETEEMQRISLLYKDKIKFQQIDINGEIRGSLPTNTSNIKGKISTTGDYYVIAKLDNEKYKTVNHDGDTYVINEKALNMHIKFGNINNCIEEYVNGQIIYNFIDMQEIYTDSDYEQQINKLYNQYVAKSSILGLDTRFEYKIEGREVKLTNYIGTSKKITLPNFITAIGTQAFMYSLMEEINLNNNLRYIGSKAFAENEIRYIDIPESVELMFTNSFINRSFGIRKTTINMLGTKTIVIQG